MTMARHDCWVNGVPCRVAGRFEIQSTSSPCCKIVNRIPRSLPRQSSQLLRGLANFSPFFRGMVPHSLLDVAHADPIRRHKLARYSPCRDFPPPILPPPFSAREKSRHYAFYKSIGIILSELSAVSSRTRSFYSDSSCFFLLFSLFFFRKRRYIGKINFIGIDESMYLRFHLNLLSRRVSLGREYIFRFEK